MEKLTSYTGNQNIFSFDFDIFFGALSENSNGAFVNLIATYKSQQKNKKKIEETTWLTEKFQHKNTLQKHIDGYQEVSVDLLGLQCSICLEHYLEKESLLRLKCQHIFHSGCISKWLDRNDSCRLCRISQPVK